MPLVYQLYMNTNSKGQALFNLVMSTADGGLSNPADYENLNRFIEQYRNRLEDLGWFMKCLNGPIARQANKEDGCTSHFCESRYKLSNSQSRPF
ncbi:MAG: hypothetical protein ACI9V8_000736 [Urechidicola sp.]|jgi:hypothetical protein